MYISDECAICGEDITIFKINEHYQTHLHELEDSKKNQLKLDLHVKSCEKETCTCGYK